MCAPPVVETPSDKPTFASLVLNDEIYEKIAGGHQEGLVVLLQETEKFDGGSFSGAFVCIRWGQRSSMAVVCIRGEVTFKNRFSMAIVCAFRSCTSRQKSSQSPPVPASPATDTLRC